MDKTIDKKCKTGSYFLEREHYYNIGLEYCWSVYKYTVIEIDEDMLEQELIDACFGC